MALGETLAQTNVYLIRGGMGWLLVDSGWNDSKTIEVFEKGLKEIGINFKDISQIVITHSHLDHFGLAGRLKELSGAKLYLHQKERRFVEPRGIEAANILEVMKKWLYKNGTPEDETARLQRLPKREMNFISPVFPDAVSFSGKLGSPDIFFSGGERISTDFFNFEVLWTPGHSPGHICLYERAKKILISGDHVLSRITPEIGLNPFSSLNPLDDYIKSLKNLRELEVELVLPGHEDYFDNLQKRIAELVQHHQERKEAVLEILKNGPEVAYEIAMKIPWMPQKGGIPWEKLDPWGHRMALMETLAHLNLLKKEGKVKKTLKGDFEFYSIS
ncbi:MAG: MBL fold metallo-hydrolase [Deltaproteobacteria bacterium]|nr:MBL fold metallo-hydrolase [Deltaproteobacteria bacterium]